MKSLLIALCAVLVACGSDSEERSTPNVTVEDHIPLPDNSGPGPNPCGKTYKITVTTDAGTFTKEIPVYCNPYADEYYGDPPDWRMGNGIWTNPAELPEVNPQQPRP